MGWAGVGDSDAAEKDAKKSGEKDYFVEMKKKGGPAFKSLIQHWRIATGKTSDFGSDRKSGTFDWAQSAA